jgi:antitoxin VapB
MAAARVFKSGNSQAVRLPKEFRLSTEEVDIFRRGDELVLRERPRNLVRAFEAALRTLRRHARWCRRSSAAGAGRPVTAARFMLDTDMCIYNEREFRRVPGLTVENWAAT